MEGNLQLLYIAWNDDQYRFSTTHDIKLDMSAYSYLQGYIYLTPLTGPMAFGLIQFIIQELKIGALLNQDIQFKPPGGVVAKLFKPQCIEEIIVDIKAKCAQIQKRLGLLPKEIKLQLTVNESRRNIPTREEITLIKKLIRGRFLLSNEIQKVLVENKQVIMYPLKDILQYLYLSGDLGKVPAVTLSTYGEYYCNRCQAKKMVKSQCLNCGNDCYYCEECLVMGESRLCAIIYAIKNNVVEAPRQVKVNFDFLLSRAQKVASDKLYSFITEQAYPYSLIWAVCGAGKTEITFKTMKEILQRGGKVLFAIPRRDVVIELEPRIKKAFPQVKVLAIYGGSEFKYKAADITLATTHQCLRFYQAFDLVILDEADAYPYQGSMMLYQALERALKPNGRFVYMSATPDKYIFQKKPFCIQVPVRYHGKPLPVPRIVIKKSKELFAREALEFLEKSRQNGHQVFIFVPTVSLAERVGGYLENIYKNEVQYSYARDKRRDDKRREFSKGKFSFFVTTTIMERGITVPKVNVLVLAADYEKVFDTGTLVQMSGRAGRTIESNGEVVFLASQVTESMRGAIKNIRQMNYEARKSGYLEE